jgi:hypothetical protein
MTPSQRQAAFDRHFASLARRRAKRLGLVFAGTIVKLPPPPLPGDPPGATRYYLNAAEPDGSASGLVELGEAANTSLRRAESWVESGKGPAPESARETAGRPKLKRKV